MSKAMTAVEMTGMVDKDRQLRLDGPVPIVGPKQVRVLVLALEEDEEEILWFREAANSEAFAFLHDSEEDLYSLEDGKPIDEG
jgi:hypothetical protein